MNLDIGRAITFVRDDPNFVVKILIGGGITFALGLVSVVINLIFGLVGGGGALLAYSLNSGSAVTSTGASLVTFFLGIISTIISSLVLLPAYGYGIQVVRNVINGQQQVLPEWNDFGQILTEGAKVWVCIFAVQLPGYLLRFGGQFPAAVAPTNTGLGLVAVCGVCFALPLFFLGLMLTPIVVGRYATTRDLAQTLNLSEMFATLRTNIGMYAIFALIMVGFVIAGFIASAFTCFIGLPFAAFFLVLVGSHLSAQAQVISQGGAMQPAYDSPYGGGPYSSGPPPYGGQRPF